MNRKILGGLRRGSGGGGYAYEPIDRSRGGGDDDSDAGDDRSDNPMLGADTPGRLRKNQVLDDMQGAVDRLGVMASRIGTEVKDHQQLISGLGAEVEQGSENIGTVMGKIGKIMGTNDRGRIYCVACLLCVNVLLLFIIVYL